MESGEHWLRVEEEAKGRRSGGEYMKRREGEKDEEGDEEGNEEGDEEDGRRETGGGSNRGLDL